MKLIDAARDVRTIARLLDEAEAEARRGGEERPGPEHLVLAAATLPDGTAAAALARVGTDAQALREAVEAAHRDVLAGAGLDPDEGAGGSALLAPARGVHRSTPQAQDVFQDAVAMSKARKPSRLRGADVVAAACRLERGTFARALDRLGIDQVALRTAAESESQRG